MKESRVIEAMDLQTGKSRFGGVAMVYERDRIIELSKENQALKEAIRLKDEAVREVSNFIEEKDKQIIELLNERKELYEDLRVKNQTIEAKDAGIKELKVKITRLEEDNELLRDALK